MDILQRKANKPRTRRDLLRDFAAYLSISVIFVGLFFGSLFVSDSWVPVLRWFWFAVYTVVLFGDFVRRNRSRWNKRKFWYGTFVLVLLHLAVFIYMLAKGQIVLGGRLGQDVLIEGLILAAITWEYRNPVAVKPIPEEPEK